MSRHLLIDGDILMFKFAFRHQTNIQWDNGADTELLDQERAIKDLDMFINRLLRQTKCFTYTICFTHQLNFRYAVLPTYKHNRANSVPPTMIRLLKNHMRDEHPWDSWEGCEADDMMGILGSSDPRKYVLTTIDKDFECIPCTLFNWNNDKKPRRITQRMADFNFHKQWLMGDPTDGFKGCQGVGKIKAIQLLKKTPPEEWSTCVVATYATHKSITYSWDDIMAQARMARILRNTDWDWNKKEPILWTPNV